MEMFSMKGRLNNANEEEELLECLASAKRAKTGPSKCTRAA